MLAARLLFGAIWLACSYQEHALQTGAEWVDTQLSKTSQCHPLQLTHGDNGRDRLLPGIVYCIMKSKNRDNAVTTSLPPHGLVSGEIVKEPLVDIFVTPAEQGGFLLDHRAVLEKVTAGARRAHTANSSSRLDIRVRVGDYLNCGDKFAYLGDMPIVLPISGKVIKLSKEHITLQKTQPVLFYSEAHIHVHEGEWVRRGAPILTLTHQTLITGDIIQGIPRIEQLFEAPGAPPPGVREPGFLHETLHSQVREIFRNNWEKRPLPAAVRQSLQEIQQVLVESIQKVYLSQGVLIADKHIEIVVRQMTSKAQVLDSGSTGLFLEEFLSLDQVENANLVTPGKRALYAPVVVGLTKSALESDSFVSAASFQETTRVLSRDAVVGKSDFLRGLKEKVVIGDLISAGTGLDIYLVYTLLSNKGWHPRA